MLRSIVTAFAFLALFSTVSSLSTPDGSFTRRDAVTAAIPAAAALLLTTVSAANADQQYTDGPQGLKYIVTNQGTGPKPQRGQKIQTSYTLWTNGFPGDSTSSKQIDSSKKPILGDQPFKLRAGVSQVIKGWDLALLDMKEGESRKLVVPPYLGYGEKGVGPIPGGATLYFEMTLTTVEPLETLSEDAQKWLNEHPLQS